jgi:hypothetical protein
VFGWTPETFWKSTLREYLAALDGWNEAHGPRKAGADGQTYEEFMEEMKEAGRV